MKGIVTIKLVKKVLLSAIILTGFAAKTNAQGFHVGVIGGPLLSTMQSDIGNYKSILGYNAGLTTDWRMANNFSLGLDVLYAANGAKRDYTQEFALNDRKNYTKFNTTENFSYLQFHLLPKFILPLGSKPIIPYDKPGDQKMFISVFAGPYFALRTGFSSKGTRSDWGILNNDTKDTTYSNMNYKYELTSAEAKMVADNDFGFTAGAGMNFNLNGGAAILSFDGRYTRSLATIDISGYYGRQYLQENKVHTEVATILHSNIGFNVGLKFRLGGE